MVFFLVQFRAPSTRPLEVAVWMSGVQLYTAIDREPNPLVQTPWFNHQKTTIP